MRKEALGKKSFGLKQILNLIFFRYHTNLSQHLINFQTHLPDLLQQPSRQHSDTHITPFRQSESGCILLYLNPSSGWMGMFLWFARTQVEIKLGRVWQKYPTKWSKMTQMKNLQTDIYKIQRRCTKYRGVQNTEVCKTQRCLKYRGV